MLEKAGRALGPLPRELRPVLPLLVAVSLVLVAPAAAFAQTKVACVGDSITQPSTGYVRTLGELLGAEYDVGNFGNSGSTMMTAEYTSTNEAYWTAPVSDSNSAITFELSKEFQPDIVTIMLGTNDSKSRHWNAAAYEEAYQAMIAEYRALDSQPTIYIVLPAPALAPECCGISGAVIQNEILPILRRVATEAGTGLIDVFGAFGDTPAVYFGAENAEDQGDGVHPNAAGHLVIANAFFDVLSKPVEPPDAGVPEPTAGSAGAPATAGTAGGGTGGMSGSGGSASGGQAAGGAISGGGTPPATEPPGTAGEPPATTPAGGSSTTLAPSQSPKSTGCSCSLIGARRVSSLLAAFAALCAVVILAWRRSLLRGRTRSLPC